MPSPTPARMRAAARSCWTAAGVRLANATRRSLATVPADPRGDDRGGQGTRRVPPAGGRRHDPAVRRLRERKHREEKPLALMFPDSSRRARIAEITELERRMLASPESPIVLLDERNRRRRPRPVRRPRESLPRHHAPLHAAASSAPARSGFAGRGDEREPLGRTDLHRRATRPWTGSGGSPTSFLSTTVRSPGTWTTRSSG